MVLIPENQLEIINPKDHLECLLSMSYLSSKMNKACPAVVISSILDTIKKERYINLIQVVGEVLEDSVFFRALSGSVGKTDTVVGRGGGLLIKVVLVLVDGKGELVDQSLKVGNLGVKLVDLHRDSLEENIISRFSFLLGESLKGKSVVQVLFDIVENSHDVVDHALVSLLWCSLGDLGEDVEDSGVTVGKTLGLGLEALKGGAKSTEHAGLEEFTFSVESILDNLSGLVEHVPNSVDLSNSCFESGDLDLSVCLKLGFMSFPSG